MYAADVEYRNHWNICPLMAFLLFSFFSPLLSSPCSFLSLQQFALSIHEGCLPFSAFTTSAPWTRWRRSVGPCTSASWHPASPPKEKASSPCSSGRPSEELCCHCWTTTTGVDLSSSMTQTEVNACLFNNARLYNAKCRRDSLKNHIQECQHSRVFLLGSSFLTFFIGLSLTLKHKNNGFINPGLWLLEIVLSLHISPPILLLLLRINGIVKKT